MNEVAKTTIFLAVAVLVALVAVFAGPSWRGQEEEDLRGRLLNPDFDNPAEAASLEIVEFDQDVPEVRHFKVARTDNQWTIPSHENYPADAEGQLGKATASLMGLKILSVANHGKSDANVREMRNQYGVVNPDTAKPSDKGVGTRVTVRDKNEKEMVSLVVGKEVPDQLGLRYVRHVDKPPVYVAKIDVDKLSTKFEDWIEDDLLKLSSWDIKRVDVQDYTVGVLGLRVFRDRKGQMTLDYDDSGDPKWKLTEDLAFDEQTGDFTPVEMAEDEELNTDKLDDLKSALGNLKIVNVQRKPPGLSTELKTAEGMRIDGEAFISLQQRGFYLLEEKVGNESYMQLLSNQGEISVVMKDGVEYVLRFGEVAGAGTGQDKKKENGDKTQGEGETKDAATADKSDSTSSDDEQDEQPGMNRYLFVMAQFNPDVIPKPEPEEPPQQGDSSPAENGTSPGDGNGSEGAKTDAAQDGAAQDGAAQDDAAQDGAAQDGAAQDDAAQDGAADTPGGDGGSPGEEAAEGEGGSPGDEPADGDAAQHDADSGQNKEGEEDDLKAERERIEKENQRKQQEYEDKITEGRKKVDELNARFADWYYIISDDVYKEIHLGRDQIVKKKEKEEETDADKTDADQIDGDKTDADQTDADKTDADQTDGDKTDADQTDGGDVDSPVSEFNKLKEGPAGNE